MRDKLISVIKDWNLPIATFATGVLVALYLVKALSGEPALALGEIQQALSQVIFNSFTMIGSLFAFGLVVIMNEEEKWGDAKDFRLYVAIGALWGAAVSAVFLLQAFGLIKL